MLALEQALAIAETLNQGQEWTHEDDKCDCTFQRIGFWYNPYLGETLEVRWCCIWAELFKQFPEFVRVTQSEPAEWNGETDMPAALWYRQLARMEGTDVATARALGFEPPKGKPIKVKPTLFLPYSGDYVEVTLG